MLELLRLILYFCAGALLGSFANVYFYRTLQGQSLLFPRSFCPHCQAPIAWFDNVPILSYLWLRRRCRICCIPISARYPLVELFCAVLMFAQALLLRFLPEPILAVFCLYTFILFLMAGIDVLSYFKNNRQYGIIPDSLQIVAAILGLLLIPFNPLVAQSYFYALGSALTILAALSLLRAFFGILFRREALGFADIKMLASAALFLGWMGSVKSFFAACLLGSVLSFWWIYRGQLRRQDSLPFGPFLALGIVFSMWLAF